MSFGLVMQVTVNDRVLPFIQLDRRHPTFEANEQIDIWLTYVLLRRRLVVLHQLLIQIDVLGGVMTTSDIQLEKAHRCSRARL